MQSLTGFKGTFRKQISEVASRLSQIFNPFPSFSYWTRTALGHLGICKVNNAQQHIGRNIQNLHQLPFLPARGFHSNPLWRWSNPRTKKNLNEPVSHFNLASPWFWWFCALVTCFPSIKIWFQDPLGPFPSLRKVCEVTSEPTSPGLAYHSPTALRHSSHRAGRKKKSEVRRETRSQPLDITMQHATNMWLGAQKVHTKK